MVDQVDGGVDDLTQVVRGNVGGHRHRDALAAIDEQVREAGRQDGRYLVLARVIVLEVDRVLVDAVEEPGGDVGQPALGVAGRGRAVVKGPEVAVAVNEGVAQAKRLGHPHQGVVEGGVAVRVVATHDVPGDPGAL